MHNIFGSARSGGLNGADVHVIIIAAISYLLRFRRPGQSMNGKRSEPFSSSSELCKAIKIREKKLFLFLSLSRCTVSDRIECLDIIIVPDDFRIEMEASCLFGVSSSLRPATSCLGKQEAKQCRFN